MFDPKMIGMESDGIHQLLYSAVHDCDIDLRRDLYSNIILSGGNTMFDGMKQRLLNEMDQLSPSSVDVHIDAPKDPCSVWIGGSLLASLSHFNDCWIRKDEYWEVGPKCIHRKCF